MANSATLFDTLSIDAMSIIVKRMINPQQENKHMVTLSYYEFDEETSDTPTTRERIRLLVLLFSENSPFRAAAAMLVSQIEVLWPYPETCIESNASMTIGPQIFQGEAKEIELGGKIFSACGPYVRKIFVGFAPEEGRKANEFVEQFTSHVLQYCRNVEEVMFCGYQAPLTKWGTASSFFREYATNLRKINWSGDEDDNGFPDLPKCKNLTRLKSHCLNTATLVSLLKACGPKLEELDILISPVGDSVEVIEAIRKYCKVLTVMNIVNLKDVIDMVGQECYVSLIRSFGSSLKSATTAGLDHDQLVEVVNTCVNLEVIVFVEDEESADWRRVNDLGPRVARLFLNPDSLHGDKYPRALEQCSNLRKLTISGGTDAMYGDEAPQVTDEMIANVFSPSRFPKLEHLTITDFRANKRNMALIASSTSNLKSTVLESFESDLEVSGFQLIADANRNLKEIKRTISAFHGIERSAKSALESLSELLKIFRKCRYLWVEISCAEEGVLKEEDLIRACKVLPCRGIDVFVLVGDVKYLYPT